MANQPESVERVVLAGTELGLSVEVIEYPDGTRTAVDAANAVGCDVGQIVKSLIFSIDDELVLALTSGANMVDTEALTSLAEGHACGRANADLVRETTGYAIGGVPPFGHTTKVRSFFDPALLHWSEVWAAAGTPRHVFRLDPQALLSATGALVGDFAQK